jgi:hypothetical protein
MLPASFLIPCNIVGFLHPKELLPHYSPLSLSVRSVLMMHLLTLFTHYFLGFLFLFSLGKITPVTFWNPVTSHILQMSKQSQQSFLNVITSIILCLTFIISLIFPFLDSVAAFSKMSVSVANN